MVLKEKIYWVRVLGSLGGIECPNCLTNHNNPLIAIGNGKMFPVFWCENCGTIFAGEFTIDSYGSIIYDLNLSKELIDETWDCLKPSMYVQ
jgi:hypothetical protein